MAELVIATKANQATLLPALLVAGSVNESLGRTEISFRYEDADTLPSGDGKTIEFTVEGKNAVFGSENVIKELRTTFPFLRGKDVKQEDLWLSKVDDFAPVEFKTVEKHLLSLDSALTLRSFVVGYALSAPDVALWGAIRGNRVALPAIRKGSMVNVSRWFKFVEDLCPWTASIIEAVNAAAKQKKAAKSKEGGNYDIDLQNTEKGVVTRFPPEPSGYLHIGHAKAALLNDFFAHEKYQGTLLVRFDDTNPTNEKEEFQDAIIEDLALMGIRPDKTSYTSDYFDELYGYCVQIIKDGNAYADDTEKETMGNQRMDGVASKRRDESIEDNLTRLEEMKTGSVEGQRWCIRAKISIDNPNKTMRDPVIYRCNPSPHHRTGTKWKIYPTYDFCCPIVDSMEGVTHALRTLEYRDRNAQYEWMLNAFKLRYVQIWDFARMNFIRTLLSKRKLTKLVNQGTVWGWDDPRFPTIRGIRRRGMTIGALREFILKQGPSKNVVNLDWTIFWATNKKYIDPVAPRHTAILNKDIVKATVKGAPSTPYTESKPKHNKNKDVGMKTVAFGDVLLIDQEDAKSFKQDEEITLMNWGNAFVRKIIKSASSDIVTELELELHLEGDFKKTEKKITWLSEKGQTLTPVELFDFDFLISKDSLQDEDNLEDFLNPKTEFKEEAVADCNVAELTADTIIQFERKGYYRVDRAYDSDSGKPAILFNIPTGKTGK
ncbi:hypothetical protein FQN54_005294 [Arachnomyces sp. PD_36]|nr:hypothetical protein FQN54_005294 [Arachnomyces sp. PD_36]